MEDLPGQFNLLMRDGTREPLQYHEVDQADENTVGIFVAIDGNEKAEMTYLREETTTFSNQMKTSKCTKNSALYTYNSPFMKTIWSTQWWWHSSLRLNGIDYFRFCPPDFPAKSWNAQELRKGCILWTCMLSRLPSSNASILQSEDYPYHYTRPRERQCQPDGQAPPRLC